MKAILVTCPHCGARLQVAGTVVDVRCEYCGSSSRIQKRTRVLERVLPPPPASPGVPVAIAVQRRSWVLPVVLSGMMFAVALPIALFARRAPTGAAQQPAVQTGSRPAQPPRAAKQSSWLGTDSAILVDLDHDGTLDIIGRARLSRPDAVTIIALDGATGTPRWESASLGGYSDVYVHPLALAGDLVLFASMTGDVRAFSSRDGTPRWTTKLEERTKAFCDAGDFVIAVGADDVERSLGRADGSLGTKTTPAKGKGCTELPTDKETQWGAFADRKLARNHDLDFDRLRVGPGGRVLSGTRAKGTKVPVLVAIDDANRQRWRVEVPVDPLIAETDPPKPVVVGTEAVCAAYKLTGDARLIAATCFATTDGRRLWHATLSSRYSSAFLLSGTSLLISMGGELEARDVQTGAVRWRFKR